MTTSTSLAALMDASWAASRLQSLGMTRDQAVAKGDLFAGAARRLVEAGHASHSTAIAVYVPGRIEVLGKHTDYCGGRSLLCAAERGMCFVAIPRTDPAIRFFAVNLQDVATFSLDPNQAPAAGHWSNYPMSVARRVARNFPMATTGADIALNSDVPSASGLSSSSAMVIGCFMILSRINRLETSPQWQGHLATRQNLAEYLGCVENGQNFGPLTGDKGVGTFGGSQDHTAILCCKPDRLSVYSFCPVAHERDIPLPADVAFLVAGSGVPAEKTGDALELYNRVSQRARRLVSLWNESEQAQATCLRQAIDNRPDAVAVLRRIAANRDTAWGLGPRLEQFLLESNTFIPVATEAIASGNWDLLRQIVNDSQRHAETDLHNQVSQTIALQRALLDSGALAASAFGAGFGGSVWGLYRTEDMPRAMKQLEGHFEFFATRPGIPAVEL